MCRKDNQSMQPATGIPPYNQGDLGCAPDPGALQIAGFSADRRIP